LYPFRANFAVAAQLRWAYSRNCGLLPLSLPPTLEKQMPKIEELSELFEGNIQKHLFQQRLLVLSEPINANVAKRTIEALLALEAADAQKDIWMFINSPGGEVNSGFAIYDAMRFVNPSVKCVVSGLCASIATVILLGADKAHRYSMPNSRVLIHQPLIGGTVQGQATDIDITAREILKTREKLVELYHKETGQALERLKKDIERDYWMSAQEAMEYGLISRVINGWGEVR